MRVLIDVVAAVGVGVVVVPLVETRWTMIVCVVSILPALCHMIHQYVLLHIVCDISSSESLFSSGYCNYKAVKSHNFILFHFWFYSDQNQQPFFATSPMLQSTIKYPSGLNIKDCAYRPELVKVGFRLVYSCNNDNNCSI